MKMNKKVIIIILIFAFITLALYSFKEFTNKEPEDSLRELVPNDYRDTEEYKNSDISEWEMYSSKELGFEMKIPRNWVCRKDVPHFANALSCFSKEADSYEFTERINKGYAVFNFTFLKKEVALYDEIKKEIELKEKFNSDAKLYFIKVYGKEAIVKHSHITEGELVKYFSAIHFDYGKGNRKGLVCGGDQKLCRDFTKSATETFKLK